MNANNSILLKDQDLRQQQQQQLSNNAQREQKYDFIDQINQEEQKNDLKQSSQEDINQDQIKRIEKQQNNNEQKCEYQSGDSIDKLNILYFIGINSLSFNTLQCCLGSLSQFTVFLLLLTINLITYLSIYKKLQVFSVQMKAFYMIKQQYLSARKIFTTRRIIITLAVILFSSLFIISLITIYQKSQLEKELDQLKAQRNIFQLYNNNYGGQNQFGQLQIERTRLNENINYLNRKLNSFIQIQEQKANQINTLKNRINLLQVTNKKEQQKQEDKKQDVSSQHHKTTQSTKEKQNNYQNSDFINQLINKQQQSQPKIRYIRPYHMNQNTQQNKNTSNQQNPKFQQEDHSLLKSQKQQPNKSQQQQNKSEQNQINYQKLSSQQKLNDERLNFFNDQINQLNSILSLSS